MNKAGGIISIIAGIFGVIAAIATLLIGGVGSAFEASGSGTIVWLGLGGVVFSFLVIVFGALAISAKSKLIGALLIVFSIAGAVLGGTFVAIFMILALIGGILSLIGAGKQKTSEEK